MSDALTRTRQSLHAVAEQIMAGHQYRVLGTIRLAVRPGGFATRTMPGTPAELAVDGPDLVVDGRRLPLIGMLSDIARAAGVTGEAPQGVYPLVIDLGPDDVLHVDVEETRVLVDAWMLGDDVLRAFSREHSGTEVEPVLWPEHLDVAITLDDVNYGVSPGDAGIPEPYAYVGPHTARDGDFWNEPFGASRLLAGLDAAALRAFFDEGRARAA